VTVFAVFSNISDPERPMNAMFSKLPKSYAADAAWSREFFPKKTESDTVAGSPGPWNSWMVGNAQM
jgi:hypothetical protein